MAIAWEDMDMDIDMVGDDDEEDNDEEDDDGEEDKAKEGYAFEADDEEVDEGAYKKKSKSPKSNTEQMREYVEKIASGHGPESKGKGEEGGTNTKSTVACKNDMGGTAGNLNQGETGETVEAGKGALKGNPVSDTSPKDMNTKNVNTPGSKNATKMSGVAKGHGAEKKGQGDSAANKKSTLGSR